MIYFSTRTDSSAVNILKITTMHDTSQTDFVYKSHQMFKLVYIKQFSKFMLVRLKSRVFQCIPQYWIIIYYYRFIVKKLSIEYYFLCYI